MDDHRDFFIENDIDDSTDNKDTSIDNSGTPVSRRHRLRRAIVLTLLFLMCVIGIAGYIRYFNPYATEAITTGYITSIERRGILFKTFEGEMITERSYGDTTRVYHNDFTFSVDNDSIAYLLQSFQNTGRHVTVSYSRYYGTLPWRGASTNVIDAVISPKEIKADNDSI